MPDSCVEFYDTTVGISENNNIYFVNAKSIGNLHLTHVCIVSFTERNIIT